MEGELAVTVAGLDHLFNGPHNIRVLELAADSVGNRKIRRPDHHRVNAGYRDELVTALDGGLGLNLENHKGLLVEVLGDFG